LLTKLLSFVTELPLEGGPDGILAPPEFGVSEKRTEREIDSLLLSAPDPASDLKI
jgi:hypothetical protein